MSVLIRGVGTERLCGGYWRNKAPRSKVEDYGKVTKTY